MLELLISKEEKIFVLPIDKAVELDDSDIENAVIASRPIDAENLASLMEVDNQNDLPPIEVTLVKGGYIVIDGRHRLRRAQMKHETTIRANVKNYKNEREVINAAFNANLKHGLRANEVTRTAYALWLFLTPNELNETMSMRDAAKLAGISHVAVSKAYAKLQNSQEIENTSQTEDETQKRKAMINPTQRLCKSLYTYFLNEEKSFTESMFSEQNQRLRTKNLVGYFNKAKNKKQTIEMLRSLASSFTNTADILDQT